MNQALPKPGIRIDGGRRRDLVKERVMAKMASVERGSPTSDQVVAARNNRAKDRRQDQRVTVALIASDGGKEGATTTAVKLKLTNSRTTSHTVRARPGTFEWRYGRNNQSALYHAGSHFAQLWERAGIAVASSADFLRGTTSGYATSPSDARVAAISMAAAATRELGRAATERLVRYCVLGETTSDLAISHSIPDRDMAAVLHQDLRSCAMHFRFL